MSKLAECVKIDKFANGAPMRFIPSDKYCKNNCNETSCKHHPSKVGIR